MKKSPFLLGQPNEFLREKISRFTSHEDYPKLIEAIALIGTNPATIHQLISMGLKAKAEEEARIFEQQENHITHIRLQVAMSLQAIFDNTAGYASPAVPHLINV